MNMTDLFAVPPLAQHGPVVCFGHQEDGDHFDEEDFARWQSSDLCAARRQELLAHPQALHLLQCIADDGQAVVDLASGPSLGLLPGVRQLAPDLPCIATDANLPVLMHHAQRYPDMGFVQCSAFRLPFRDASIGAYTSYIGLSSTRSGATGYRQALAELHRTLRPGGKLYAMESEWSDVPAILDLFRQHGKRPWDCFLQEQVSWHDLFLQSGFRILHEAPYRLQPLRPDDNELGEMAASSGVEVGLRHTAFILEKGRSHP